MSSTFGAPVLERLMWFLTGQFIFTWTDLESMITGETCWTKHRLHTFYLKSYVKSNDQADTYQCTLECSFTCNFSMFLAQPTTVIPCSTKAVAIAPPMPSEAPVTTATRPDQRSIFIQFLLLWTPCVTRLSSTRLWNYCSISADTL